MIFFSIQPLIAFPSESWKLIAIYANSASKWTLDHDAITVLAQIKRHNLFSDRNVKFGLSVFSSPGFVLGFSAAYSSDTPNHTI